MNMYQISENMKELSQTQYIIREKNLAVEIARRVGLSWAFP